MTILKTAVGQGVAPGPLDTRSAAIILLNAKYEYLLGQEA